MCNVKKKQCCPNILEMKIDIAKIFRIWIRRFSCLFKGGRSNDFHTRNEKIPHHGHQKRNFSRPETKYFTGVDERQETFPN